MKTSTVPGSTSQIRHVFIYDSASTVGAGKTALAFGDITAYYVRSGGTLTALAMVNITTLGTWDTDVTDDKLGFKKLDDTNAPGLYEIHLPNNILEAGADTVCIQLLATGAVPCNIEIQLASAPATATGDTGITLEKVLEMLAAFMAGKISRSTNAGVATFTFKKRDGSTTSFTAVCDEDDGDRATTGSLS
jgi:hypothetical protein